MRKTISLVIASVLALTSFASCTAKQAEVTEASSDYADDAWLEARIGDIPDGVTVGTSDSIGIDMSDFENDGYIIRNVGDETIICGKTVEGLDLAVRAYAKAYEADRTIDKTYHEGYRIDRFTIDGNDISEYKIVYEGEADSSSSEEHNNAYFAAKQLKRLIKEACGADLEITDTDCDRMLKIGYLTDNKHGENGFKYEVKDGNLYLYGVGKANGCGNGVFFFMQEECGWYELLWGDSDLAECEWLNIENGTSADVDPMFDYAYPYYITGDIYHPVKYDHSLYTGYISHCCHGQQSNKWGGYDVTDKQICYTDETVQEDVNSDIFDYLKRKQNAGIKVKIVDISHGDNQYFCYCKNCVKLLKEENMSQAGLIVRFANNLCEYIGDDFPDVKVGIFAYQGTNMPPNTVPDDNIYITFCTDHGCGYHYVDGEDCCTYTTTYFNTYGSNKHFGSSDVGEWLRKWTDMSDNVYIWHYGLDLYGHQITQDHNFYHDMMFFKECGVKGMFYEDEFYSQGEGLIRLKEMMMLQFHPDYTEEEYDEAVRELYEKEFGDGGGYALAYTKNIWSRVQLAAGCGDFWVWDIIQPEQNDYELFHETEEEARELLEKTIYLANSAYQQMRAEAFSLDILYKSCWYNYFRAYDRNDTEEIAKLEKIYNLYIERREKVGIPLSYSYLSWWYANHEIQTTLEDAAWIDCQPFRELLTDEGVEMRPCPEKYEGVELPKKVTRAW